MIKKRLILSVAAILASIVNLYAQANRAESHTKENIFPLADTVKTMAETLIKKGFNAGDGYGEVWIRDFNTFMNVACAVNDRTVVRKHLITFFQFQQPDGAILDGYVPDKNSSGVGYNYYHSKLAPGYAGHKNTVETDQESSLIQAVARYIKNTGDADILKEQVGGITVLKRLEMAMQFLLTKRYDKKYNLIWGATTADWGDVQPEHAWGVEINENTHRAIDIYDNAMFIIAIDNYIAFPGLNTAELSKWKKINKTLRLAVRQHLWDKQRQKFKPHIYLNGSPFPESFNEDDVYYHGGTTVAMEAGLLSKAEIKAAYAHMMRDVQAANAATIGLTLYPPYPTGTFKNTGMGPYVYQNGGDWTWFGARTVSQLIRYGFTQEACEALQPMLERVLKNKGFYEWYTPDNKPMGSSSFRGEAGVLWDAITELKKQLAK